MKRDHELVKLVFTPGDHLIYGLIVRHLVFFLTETKNTKGAELQKLQNVQKIEKRSMTMDTENKGLDTSHLLGYSH